MDQITVPQFIDNEDKILGPISVRQFIIVLIAGVVIFLAYKLADLVVFIVIAIVVGGSAGILGFYKVNGQAFHFFLLNALRTAKTPSLRIWRKDPANSFLPSIEDESDDDDTKEDTPIRHAQPIKRLSELSLIVDTGGAFHEGDTDKGTELF